MRHDNSAEKMRERIEKANDVTLGTFFNGLQPSYVEKIDLEEICCPLLFELRMSLLFSFPNWL